MVLEITDLVHTAIPEDMPLFVRISGTDWLTPILAERGVEFFDVSSRGVHPKQSTNMKSGLGYQAPFAMGILKTVKSKIMVSAVGGISTVT